MGGLYVPNNAPWKADLINEMMSFPVGVHDDQVDALGLVGQLLDKMTAGRVEKPAKKPLPDEIAFEVRPDGRVVSNMSIREIVEAKARKRRMGL